MKKLLRVQECVDNCNLDLEYARIILKCQAGRRQQVSKPHHILYISANMWPKIAPPLHYTIQQESSGYNSTTPKKHSVKPLVALLGAYMGHRRAERGVSVYTRKPRQPAVYSHIYAHITRHVTGSALYGLIARPLGVYSPLWVLSRG